jgi:Na+/H+-translocating membrane pyrophosphatase
MENLIYIIPAFGVIALIYMFVLSKWVTKQGTGNSKMVEISTYIREGAMAFLKAEYRVLAIFVLIAGASAWSGLTDCGAFITLYSCGVCNWSCVFCNCGKYWNAHCNSR